MPVLGRRRLNGVPMGTSPIKGVAPSAISNFSVTSVRSDSIVAAYNAAVGSAEITYTGWTALHSSGNWLRNAGNFTSSGGTYTALASGTSYDLRVICANAYGSSATDLLTGTSTESTAASGFSVSLSRASGSPGVGVTMTVVPVGGSWPNGEVITPSATGFAGSFDNTSLIGNGTGPLTFTFTPASGPGASGALTATANGLSNLSGAQSYSINSSSTSTAANRFDVTSNKSAVPPGSPVQLTIFPNANFPSGHITLSGTNGTFSPTSTVVLSQGSTTPVTITYTPTSAGEHVISASNSAGLYNPYPAPLTVFPSSSGTGRSLSASLTRADMVTFQRDAASGSPAGFSLPWAKGWGEVWLSIAAISGFSDGLWIRLYDASSPNASAAVGSGTALHSLPVQVYGPISGAGTIRVLLPAGPYIYYADLATDAAFTSPVRVAQRFRVGVVIAHFSRSQESGLSRAYAYTGNVPLPTTYAKTATWVGFDYRYPDLDSGWFTHDGVAVDPYQYHYSEASSSGAQEIGRLLESQLGVCTGVAGSSATGGGLDNMVNHDGSLAGGFAGSVGAAVGGKFRYFWMATGGWDGVDSANFPNESHAENRNRYFAAVDWIARSYPACAVIGWVTSASGMFGNDGSSLVGYTRNQSIILNEIEPNNPMVVSKECYSWNEYYTNHATMASRVQYVRAGFRLLMAAEHAAIGGFQTGNRGPRLATTGTMKSGTRVVSIPFSLGGGTALQFVGVTCSNPAFTVNSATGTEIATLFALYQSGGYRGNGTAITIDSVSVNAPAATIDLTLSGSSGVVLADNTLAPMPSGFTVQFAADFTASNNSVPLGSGRAIMITDDRIDTANGIPHGWHMRPALDIAISIV